MYVVNLGISIEYITYILYTCVYIYIYIYIYTYTYVYIYIYICGFCYWICLKLTPNSPNLMRFTARHCWVRCSGSSSKRRNKPGTPTAGKFPCCFFIMKIVAKAHTHVYTYVSTYIYIYIYIYYIYIYYIYTYIYIHIIYIYTYIYIYAGAHVYTYTLCIHVYMYQQLLAWDLPIFIQFEPSLPPSMSVSFGKKRETKSIQKPYVPWCWNI